MGIIPVADTINGTTYSALCFHSFLLSLQDLGTAYTLLLLLLYYYYYYYYITNCLIYAWLI
jgi:hypothetical protein